MDDFELRNSVRERILNDLKNIVKQIYHESVNNELSPENKTYICLTLIKNLDETLRHGLKQLHLGYWKPVSRVLHPQTLQSIDRLPLHNETKINGLTKGRAWIALSLKDESLINYIECFVREGCLEKHYEDWSILRTNDSCNHFLSVLSGLDNVKFTYELEYVNKLPTSCNFGVKMLGNLDRNVASLNLNSSKTSMDLGTSSSSLTSPVDSGVHIQDSTYDMEQLSDDNNKDLDIDFLNGNVPEPVTMRKHKKNSKRHVSFHEDIIYKSPEKCRKLKWDSDNLRYSWSGEQIDSSILKGSDFAEGKITGGKTTVPLETDYHINERGTPEGEETPPRETEPEKFPPNKSPRSIIIKRFLLSLGRNQTRTRHDRCKRPNCAHCNLKKLVLDPNLAAETNKQIRRELVEYSKPDRFLASRHEVHLDPDMVKDMIRNQKVYKCYKLRDCLFIMTNANVHLVNKNLEMRRIHFRNVHGVVVYPDFHAFSIQESEVSDSRLESHFFVTGDVELTNELLGRLEYCMRRNQYDPPLFTLLDPGHFSFVKKALVDGLALDRRENFVYSGSVRLFKETDLLNSVLPTSKRGFLMYRHIGFGDGGWIPGDFCLKNGVLYLFEDDTSLPKLAVNISTGCQSCNRTKNPDRPHTFQMALVNTELTTREDSSGRNFQHQQKPSAEGKLFSRLRQKVGKMLTFGGSKDSCCVLEFAAANEFEVCEWFQMIIAASCGDSCEEAHKDDMVEGMLWVTADSLTITNEVWTGNQTDVEIISCAQLRDVATFKIGDCDKDLFVVIEFICIEANSTSGDWILFLSSREELMKVMTIFQTHWKLKEKFPCEEMREGRLLNRCRKFQGNLGYNCWTPLLK